MKDKKSNFDSQKDIEEYLLACPMCGAIIEEPYSLQIGKRYKCNYCKKYYIAIKPVKNMSPIF